MRPQTPLFQASATTPHPAPRPGAAEFVQRWNEDGGIEGTALEWMLDRMRPPREART